MIRLLRAALPVFYFIRCMNSQIVDVEIDFDKVNSDEELADYVSEILDRIRTFKVPVHPRIRLFYQLLKKGMSVYADRTSDTLYTPLKYNNNIDINKKDELREKKAEEMKKKTDAERKRFKEEQSRDDTEEKSIEEKSNEETTEKTDVKKDKKEVDKEIIKKKKKERTIVTNNIN